jgi:hypothetical protein
MTALANMQALFHGHVVGDGPDAVELFVGDQQASAAERVGVYYDAYRLRLLEVLADDFPGLVVITGDTEFRDIGLRYLDSHPPTEPSVRWFGRHLADFLGTDAGCRDRSYLAEMARFELARGLAFDAVDSKIASLEEVAAIAPDKWPEVCLDLHPTLQKLEFNWNTGPVWRAILNEETVPEPARLEAAVSWSVWRRDITVYWRSLSDVEVFALDEFGRGQAFAEVCVGMCGWMDEASVPASLAAMLNQWITEGMVMNIRLES